MRGTRPAHTLESFLAKRVTIDPESGCWVCHGASPRYGYQIVRIAGTRWRAHRWVYTQIVGPIPEGLVIDHLCRNTSCVNPDHLEPVTQLENSNRRRADACGKGHRFTPENTYTTRTKRGGTSRQCRRCVLDRSKTNRAARDLAGDA